MRPTRQDFSHRPRTARGSFAERAHPPQGPRYGLARILSKLGYCSRSQAALLIAAGRVTVNGSPRLDPEWPVIPGKDQIQVDGQSVKPAAKVYVALNKPRGLVTTASDEKGRETVFACLSPAGCPHLGAVGRLDKASEGLLLFTNDSAWAARLTDPASRLEKVYHVQVNGIPDAQALRQMVEGVQEGGELLRARSAKILRAGERNAWLEIVLDEGKNRHIRRLTAGLALSVLRLIRVAIGPLQLGHLEKGKARLLSSAEVAALEKSVDKGHNRT